MTFRAANLAAVWIFILGASGSAAQAAFVNASGSRVLFSSQVDDETQITDIHRSRTGVHRNHVGPWNSYSPMDLDHAFDEFDTTFAGGYACNSSHPDQPLPSAHSRQWRRAAQYGSLGLFPGVVLGLGLSAIPFIGPVAGGAAFAGSIGTGAYQGQRLARDHYATCLAMRAFRVLLSSPAIAPAAPEGGWMSYRRVPANLLDPELLPDLDAILARVNSEWNRIFAPIPAPDADDTLLLPRR